jgi:enoyl-CoA hydratase/carnithine racemase
MDYRNLRLTLDAPIARLTLARPADANRIDSRTLVELQDATSTIAATEGIALVVLDADGADFSLGWDAATRDELQAQLATAFGALDPFGCLADLPCPVLAVVNGRAHGAGLELALAADVRICSADASFALPDLEDGRLPLAGGTQRLPRIVGRSRGASMLLLAEAIDAETALAAGLVSRVFPTNALAADATALAVRIASRGPVGLRYAKEAVHKGLELPLEHALRYELDLSIILQTTADRAEGVQAFLEKRPPTFRNQ